LRFNCPKEAFNKLSIKKYKIRRRNSKQLKEPAAYFISPDGFETGWGARTPSNNLFGVKADSGCKTAEKKPGPFVTTVTREEVNGRIPVASGEVTV